MAARRGRGGRAGRRALSAGRGGARRRRPVRQARAAPCDLGRRAPARRARRLHRKIDQALVRAGLEPERRAYLPHITLARLNAAASGNRRLPRPACRARQPALVLGHFTLFESHLGHEAARYEPVERYPLR
ncbi:MAG: 2'-5' RNA ligase family protein [Sphingomonas sp.]